MPSIWTHILFSEDVLDTVTGPHPFAQIEAFMKLGAQGPDLFFYDNISPWASSNYPAQKIGSRLHEQHCGDFIIDLIEAAKNEHGQLRAYVFGFISHYLLDRNTNPYIDYLASYEGMDRRKIKLNIDTLIMERTHNLKTWEAPVYKEIDVGFRLNQDIVLLLHQLISKHYPENEQDSPGYIKKAYRDMKRALKLLADPYGWNSKLLKSRYATHFHQPIDDNIDYLNIQAATWYHPVTKKPSSKSFLDLYEDARAEGLEIMPELLNYWESNNDTVTDKLIQLIGNKSYETGLPLTSTNHKINI